MLVRNKPVEITKRPRLNATSYYQTTNPDICESIFMNSKFNNAHIESMWEENMIKNPDEVAVELVKEFFNSDPGDLILV